MGLSTSRRCLFPRTGLLAVNTLGLTLAASTARALSITGDAPPSDSNFGLHAFVIVALIALVFPTLGVAMLAMTVQALTWWAGDVLRPGQIGFGMFEPLEQRLIFIEVWTVQLLAALILPFLAGALLRAGWTRARAASLGAALALGGFAAVGGWRLGETHIIVVVAGLLAATAISTWLASGARTRREPPYSPGEPVEDFLCRHSLSTGLPLVFYAWSYGFSGVLSPLRERLQQKGSSFANLAREIGVKRGALTNARRLTIGVLLLWCEFWGSLLLWGFGITGTLLSLVITLSSLGLVSAFILESLVALAACRKTAVTGRIR